MSSYSHVLHCLLEVRNSKTKKEVHSEQVCIMFLDTDKKVIPGVLPFYFYEEDRCLRMLNLESINKIESFKRPSKLIECRRDLFSSLKTSFRDKTKSYYFDSCLVHRYKNLSSVNAHNIKEEIRERNLQATIWEGSF